MELDEILRLIAICIVSLVVIIYVPWPDPSADDIYYIVSSIIELLRKGF